MKGEKESFEKPIVVRLKTLGMIHAYRPNLLKECMASEKSFTQKYASSGECSINDAFTKTALILFRDWREKIHARLAFLVDTVTASEQVLEPTLEGKVREAVGELKTYSSKIQLQIEGLCSQRDDFKLMRLREKYTLLLEASDHVLKLVDCMHSLNAEVEKYLQAKKNSNCRDS
jgi:hypothetical protein